MRTLQLTDEEVAIILRALGIAEKKFFDLRDKYIVEVVRVRGFDKFSDAKTELDTMLARANECCDLLMDIENGSKDV